MERRNANSVGGADAAAFFFGGGKMGAQMRARDWSATPLGPPAEWPQSLRTVVRMMLDSRYAMWCGWGSDLLFFYNDAYARDTLGTKHPWALGRPAREVWSEIWADISPRIDRVLRTGEATWDQDLLLFLERSGYPEETYLPHVLLQPVVRRRRESRRNAVRRHRGDRAGHQRASRRAFARCRRGADDD